MREPPERPHAEGRNMAELLEQLRPKAFAIAYRMLGSVSDAEDVVQDAYLRYHQAQRDGTPFRTFKQKPSLRSMRRHIMT